MDSHWSILWRTVLCEGPHTGAGEKCTKREQQGWTVTKRLQPQFPILPVLLRPGGGWRVGDEGVNLNLERRGTEGKVVWFYLCSSPSYFIFNQQHFIYLLSQVDPVLPMTLTGKWSLSWPMSFSILSSPPVPLRRGNERLTGWTFDSKPKSTHHFQNWLQITVNWSLLKTINSTLLSQN